jgi:hypothetical protein
MSHIPPNPNFQGEGGSQSLGRSRERCGKHRGISRKKESICRLDKLPNGESEPLKIVRIHPHTITCGSDHAGMTFHEVCGGNASRVDDNMPNTPEPFQPRPKIIQIASRSHLL